MVNLTFVKLLIAATAPIERLHILERHFSSLFDHLGVEIVAIGLMEEKVLSHQEVLQILTYNTFQSTADRSKALIAIISAVKEKGLAPLMHILEQTSNSYAGHWKIMNALQSDPNFVKYL